MPESKLTVADGRILAPDGRSTSYGSSPTTRCSTGPPAVSTSRSQLPRTTSSARACPGSICLTSSPADPASCTTCRLTAVLWPGRPAPVPRRDPHRSRYDGDARAAGRAHGGTGRQLPRVVAEGEEVALSAAARLRADAIWERHPTLPDPGGLPGFCARRRPRQPCSPSVRLPGPGMRLRRRPRLPITGRTWRTRPWGHRVQPPCSPAGRTARRAAGASQVWSHTQGVYLLRRRARPRAAPAADHVDVRHAQGAGCYGHNGADDAAMDAALIAMPFRPARPGGLEPGGRVALGAVGRSGRGARRRRRGRGRECAVVAARDLGERRTRPGPGSTRQRLLANSHRAGGEQIQAAAEPPMANGGGTGRNSVPDYDFPAYRVVNHRCSTGRCARPRCARWARSSTCSRLSPSWTNSPRRRPDPVDYRLARLSDPRARAVIEAAARAPDGNWSPAESRGHGIGFARYKNSSATAPWLPRWRRSARSGCGG